MDIRRLDRTSVTGRSLRALVLALVALASVLLPTSPAAASAGWINECLYSHSLKHDPIVYPDQPGRSHLHDFFGAEDTDASSSYRSMLKNGTTCVSPDTAGYWIPALYEDGERRLARGFGTDGEDTDVEFYYRDSNLDEGTRIRAYPPNMKLLAGNGWANAELGDDVYWGCFNGSNITNLPRPPESCPDGVLTLHIRFPNCWDGEHINMAKHPKAVVYPNEERDECPRSNPIALPWLIERYEWPLGRGDFGRITLSSGSASTIHGDFWNTWNQDRLKKLVANCLNADVDCEDFEAPGT